MSINVLIVFVAVVAVSYAASIDDGGGNAFENIDIGDFRDNPERIDDLLDCFTKDSECNEYDAAIKERASQIASTGCGSCSEKEKIIFKKLFNIIIIKRPQSVTKCIDFFNKSGNIFKILGIPTLGTEYPTDIKSHIVKNIPDILIQATDFLTSDDVVNFIDSAKDLITGLRGKSQSKT